MQILVALILTLGGGLIGRYLRHRDRERKTFDYRIVSDVPLMLTKNKPERLKLTIGNLEVKEPRVTEIRFENTGNKTIDEEDFLGEPYIIRRPDATLLDFNVIEKSSEHLLNHPLEHVLNSGTLADQRGDEEIWIRPRTLNKGDWFTLQVVYDGGSPDSPPIIIGRVRDESRPTAIYTTKQELQANRISLWARIALFTIAGLLLLKIFVDEYPDGNLIPPIIVAVLLIISLGLKCYQWRRERKRRPRPRDRN